MHSHSWQIDPHPLLHLLCTSSGSGGTKGKCLCSQGNTSRAKRESKAELCVLRDPSWPPWGHLSWCNYKPISALLRTSASPCSRGELERKAIPCPHKARRYHRDGYWKYPSSVGSQKIWGCFFLVAPRSFFYAWSDMEFLWKLSYLREVIEKHQKGPYF